MERSGSLPTTNGIDLSKTPIQPLARRRRRLQWSNRWSGLIRIQLRIVRVGMLPLDIACGQTLAYESKIDFLRDDYAEVAGVRPLVTAPKREQLLNSFIRRIPGRKRRIQNHAHRAIARLLHHPLIGRSTLVRVDRC